MLRGGVDLEAEHFSHGLVYIVQNVQALEGDDSTLIVHARSCVSYHCRSHLRAVLRLQDLGLHTCLVNLLMFLVIPVSDRQGIHHMVLPAYRQAACFSPALLSHFCCSCLIVMGV